MKGLDKQFAVLMALSAALVVLAASFAAVVLADVRPVQMQTGRDEPSEDLLSVSGQAEITLTPDMVTLMLTAEERASTPSEALSRVSTAAQNVVSTLLRRGLTPEEVKTTGLNIYPEYVYREKEPPQIVGYIATYTVEVKTKRIAEAGALIEAAVNAGADYVSGIYFSLSTEQYRNVYRQLLSAAVSDAEAKANALLTPLGLKTVRVKSVSIAEWTPIPYARVAAADAAPSGPPVMPGTTSVSATVNVVYVIGPR
ncbi:MAG: SIMPL domain-containing protein [Candidatus Caldarchaeum sp.]|nr:SIMPL domain-containing protein [Candidatus Caldarchaeum sp.]